MTTLNIRFIAETGFVGDAIREVTFSKWSHVEIILPDGSFLGAHLKGGVAIRKPDYCKPKRERRYAIPVEPDALQKMMDFAHSQIGKPYDCVDIAGIFVHRDWHQRDKWICSELVAAIAEAGGLFLLNALPEFVNLITPEMLHLSPHFIGNCYYEHHNSSK